MDVGCAAAFGKCLRSLQDLPLTDMENSKKGVAYNSMSFESPSCLTGLDYKTRSLEK